MSRKYTGGVFMKLCLFTRQQIRLDTIGISVFGHDFGTLKGQKPPILEPLHTFLDSQLSFMELMINGFLPFLPTPTKNQAALKDLRDCIRGVAFKSLERAKKEKEVDNIQGMRDRSIIGTLGKVRY